MFYKKLPAPINGGFRMDGYWVWCGTVVNENPIFPPERFHIEDPFIWRNGDHYELIAKDMDGTLCGEKYGGVHAHSKDGFSWEIHEKPLAYSRTVQMDDGSIRTLGNFERPFLLFQDGRPTHLFGAVSDGKHGFGDALNTWNMVIPLRN